MLLLGVDNFDNVIIGFEGAHTMKRWRFGNKRCETLKLDMSKVYDRVECLEAVMLRLGYSLEWVSLAMKCVRSVSFSFNINGTVIGYITL